MKWMIALALILSCGLGAWGAETDPGQLQQFVVRIDVVQSGDEAAAHLGEQTRLAPGFVAQASKSGQMHLLQTMDILLVTKRDARCLIGRKTPLAYYDPKYAQFQIQYVDTGLKTVVNCTALTDKTYRLDVVPEFSIQAGMHAPGGAAVSAYPLTQVMVAKVILTAVHVGDSFVVGHARGGEARMVLAGLGVTSPGDHLLIVVSLLRP